MTLNVRKAVFPGETGYRNFFLFSTKNNMYWINLWREISIWQEVKKVADQNLDLLKENNLRVDWVGRIYTVFNLPQEVLETPSTREPWLSAQLKAVDDVLLQLNISDLVYPEFSQIEGTDSYLLVLYPENEYMTWSRFLFNLALWGGGIYGTTVLFRWMSSIPSINKFFTDISQYL